MYMCMWSCFDKYIELQLGPLQTKFSGSAPVCGFLAMMGL